MLSAARGMVAIGLLLLPGAVAEGGANLNIVDFGGRGDNRTSNTAAFVRAIAALKQHKGGTLTVGASPVGSDYLVGPFNLTSHMRLVVEEGVTLIASTDLAEWPLMPAMPSYGQGRDHPGPRRVSFIHGFNLTNVTVTGQGTIDGNGPFWWARHRSRIEQYTRGHLIEFMWSTTLEVSHLTLVNSPFWTVHPCYCDDFIGHHLRIINDNHSPNTDGIDPDSTINVLLHNNYISTGDDCYALKSGWDSYGIKYGRPTRNITIRDGYCRSPTSAGVCIGSEMSGGVSDVYVSNMTIENTGYAFRVKTGVGRGGYVERLNFTNSVMVNCSTGFEFSEFYGGHPQGGFNVSALPVVRGILTQNVTGKASVVADIRGLPHQSYSSRYAMQGINFVEVSVTGGAWKCSNVFGSASNSPGACPCLPSGCR